jgi:hypothetical protein
MLWLFGSSRCNEVVLEYEHQRERQPTSGSGLGDWRSEADSDEE